MSKKVTTKNDLRYAAPPDTQDTIAYRKSINDVDMVTPIVNTYGQMQKQVEDEAFYDDNLPEAVRNKQKYARMFALNTSKGAAMSDAYGRQAMARTGNLGNLASMTANQMHNYGSTQKTSDPMGMILGAAGGAGGLMSGMGAMGMT